VPSPSVPRAQIPASVPEVGIEKELVLSSKKPKVIRAEEDENNSDDEGKPEIPKPTAEVEEESDPSATQLLEEGEDSVVPGTEPLPDDFEPLSPELVSQPSAKRPKLAHETGNVTPARAVSLPQLVLPAVASPPSSSSSQPPPGFAQASKSASPPAVLPVPKPVKATLGPRPTVETPAALHSVSLGTRSDAKGGFSGRIGMYIH
jgi:hypothetical protein